MKTLGLLLLTGIALLAPTLSWADLIIATGNNPQPGEENVLLNSGSTGSTVTGTTNQTGFTVNFSSATQILSEPSSGQARIEATNGSNQVALGDINFSLANGTFTDAIFNAFIGGTIGVPGNVTITVSGSDGNTPETLVTVFSLGNGQNFFTITAINGEVINSISISAPNGFTDLRQVRISGATGPTPVPDMGATLPLIGLGLLGLAIVRRRFAAS
jgi:hypothetical protein